jgi:hypothetical protein
MEKMNRIRCGNEQVHAGQSSAEACGGMTVPKIVLAFPVGRHKALTMSYDDGRAAAARPDFQRPRGAGDVSPERRSARCGGMDRR